MNKILLDLWGQFNLSDDDLLMINKYSTIIAGIDNVPGTQGILRKLPVSRRTLKSLMDNAALVALVSQLIIDAKGLTG